MEIPQPSGRQRRPGLTNNAPGRWQGGPGAQHGENEHEKTTRTPQKQQVAVTREKGLSGAQHLLAAEDAMRVSGFAQLEQGCSIRDVEPCLRGLKVLAHAGMDPADRRVAQTLAIETLRALNVPNGRRLVDTAMEGRAKEFAAELVWAREVERFQRKKAQAAP